MPRLKATAVKVKSKKKITAKPYTKIKSTSKTTKASKLVKKTLPKVQKLKRNVSAHKSAALKKPAKKKVTPKKLKAARTPKAKSLPKRKKSLFKDSDTKKNSLKSMKIIKKPAKSASIKKTVVNKYSKKSPRKIQRPLTALKKPLNKIQKPSEKEIIEMTEIVAVTVPAYQEEKNDIEEIPSVQEGENQYSQDRETIEEKKEETETV